jgi:hypothetical protein
VRIASAVLILETSQEVAWRNAFYYRYYDSRTSFNTPRHLGIRTKDSKLIHFDELNQWELYDLNKDPSEMRNLANEQEYRTIRESLEGTLLKIQWQLGDDPADIGDHPRTGNAALDAEIARRANEKKEAIESKAYKPTR